MGNLTKEILAEKENVEKVLNNLKDVEARHIKSVIELAAIAAFLHNIYNGIENILKQVLKVKGFKVPQSKNWHKDLLNFSTTEKIITKKLADELYEYLTFRHFFVHGYSFELKEAQLQNLTHNIPAVWSRFILEIERVIKNK
ncbi:MAG: hypothetical protein ABIH18_01370 [Candidatus Omnitrophota bacterium]